MAKKVRKRSHELRAKGNETDLEPAGSTKMRGGRTLVHSVGRLQPSPWESTANLPSSAVTQGTEPCELKNTGNIHLAGLAKGLMTGHMRTRQGCYYQTDVEVIQFCNGTKKNDPRPQTNPRSGSTIKFCLVFI